MSAMKNPFEIPFGKDPQEPEEEGRRSRLTETTYSKLPLDFFLSPYRKAVRRRELYQKGGPFAPEPGPWKDLAIRPLMRALRRHMGCPITFRGPFGLKCRFYLEARGHGSIELVWMGPALGIGKTDYAKNTREYRPGTIGFWNGLNHPDLPLPSTTTVEQIAGMMRASSRDNAKEDRHETRKNVAGTVG